MTTAGDEGCGTRTDRYFFAKTCVFPSRGGNLAAELKKNDKIDCQSPRAELEIGRLRSPILTGRHKQRDYLALAQMAKRALKQVGGTFAATEGGFLEISSTKNVKSSVFQSQEPLFARGSFTVSVFHGPEANK